MPQTVFDVGDLITTRLDLGVTPDGTTNVTLTIYKPDGTTQLPSGGPTGPTDTDQWTAQWPAADPGDYVVVWSVSGTGAGTQAKVFNVRALPSPSDTRPAWSPFLSEVADYISRLTVDMVTPGSQVQFGTFNGNTSPTDEQAHRLLDSAVISVVSRLGVVAAAAEPAARVVSAIRAAAMIARSFPRSAVDLATADALDRRADIELALLVDANADVGGGDDERLLAVWAFPEPVAWGDWLL